MGTRVHISIPLFSRGLGLIWLSRRTLASWCRLCLSTLRVRLLRISKLLSSKTWSGI